MKITKTRTRSRFVRISWYASRYLAMLVVVASLLLCTVAVDNGWASAASPCPLPDYVGSSPCTTPTPDYTFPGMVLPVRAGDTLPAGKYDVPQVTPADVRCTGTLIALGAAVVVTKGAVVELSVPE